VQAPVPEIAAGSGRGTGEVPSVLHRLPGNVTDPVVPGGFDQQPPDVAVAGLGDRSL